MIILDHEQGSPEWLVGASVCAAGSVVIVAIIVIIARVLGRGVGVGCCDGAFVGARDRGNRWNRRNRRNRLREIPVQAAWCQAARRKE